MSSSRKARRRRDRSRARQPRNRHALSIQARLGLVIGGLAGIAAGVALLLAGGPGTASRLGRVAGILILLGAVAIGAAALGHV